MRFFDLTGILQRARRAVSRPTSVSSEEVKDDVKLAEILRQLSVRVQELEARLPQDGVEFEVNLTDGGTVRLNHQLGCPVRWYVTHWKSSETNTVSAVSNAENKWEDWVWPTPIQRGCSIGTWTSSVPGAPGYTVGCRYRMKKVRPIMGVRFMWKSVGAAKTIRCKVWNDSTGVSLGSVDVAVNANGIYQGFFSSPITTDLTAVDIVVSCYSVADGTNSFNNDVVWFGLVPIELDDNLTLKHQGLFSGGGTGDARPTGAVAGGHFMIEPILAISDTVTTVVPNDTGVQLSYSSESNSNMLVLTSNTTGRAVIRVEPSQSGLSP